MVVEMLSRTFFTDFEGRGQLHNLGLLYIGMLVLQFEMLGWWQLGAGLRLGCFEPELNHAHVLVLFEVVQAGGLTAGEASKLHSSGHVW